MRVPVALHVHERNGSADSRTPAGEMVDAYKQKYGTPLAIGFVGHDHAVRVNHPDVVTLDGVEHEIRKRPTRLHVVEFLDHDFKYLAHPKTTFPDDTADGAMRAVERYDLDAVEKYNAGSKQYDGSLGVPEIAGDDSHSPLGVGESMLAVDVDRLTEDAVVDELKAGRVHMMNDPSRSRGVAHQAEKSLYLASEIARGRESFPWL